jgi:outer membrane protein
MKRILALAITLAVIAALLVAIARQTRIERGGLPMGYVNMQRIVSESPREKANGARLTQMQQQKAQEIGVLQRQYEATRRQLAEVQGLSGSVRQSQLEHEEQRLRGQLERTTAGAQTELQTMQRQIQAELRTRLAPVVNTIATSRGMQMVLTEEAGVVWAAPGLDLTDAVLQRLNADVPAPAPK